MYKEEHEFNCLDGWKDFQNPQFKVIKYYDNAVYCKVFEYKSDKRGYVEVKTQRRLAWIIFHTLETFT